MSAIVLQNIDFRYPNCPQAVFENFSAVLDTDWKLALIGRNGRGKTTLLRLLGGELRPDSGHILHSVPLEYYPFSLPDGNAGTAVYAALPDLQLWRLRAELHSIGLPASILERETQTLSGGERTKLLLAALFAREHAFLLIDEPTNHLDEAGRSRLADYLQTKRGFILVSHDRAFLDRCCDHVLALNTQGYTLRKGTFSDWWKDKTAADAAEDAKNERLRRQIDALQRSAVRTHEWAARTEASKNQKKSGLHPDKGYIGAKAAKMEKRAKAAERRREAAIEEKSALLKNADFYGRLKLSPLPFRTRTLCSLTHVSFGYDSKPVLQDCTFRIEQGARIACKGENGSGKSTLLRLIAGLLAPSEGILARPNDLIVSYLPQDTRALSGRVAAYAQAHGASPDLVLAILNKLNFRSELFDADIAAYSDGQKKKVALAVSLATPAHLYLWDEPLNYIDLVSRIQLEELIRRFCPTLLFVEHDAMFCQNVATESLRLETNPGSLSQRTAPASP